MRSSEEREEQFIGLRGESPCCCSFTHYFRTLPITHILQCGVIVFVSSSFPHNKIGEMSLRFFSSSSAAHMYNTQDYDVTKNCLRSHSSTRSPLPPHFRPIPDDRIVTSFIVQFYFVRSSKVPAGGKATNMESRIRSMTVKLSDRRQTHLDAQHSPPN